MGNLTDHQRVGGEGVHISDCHVWAEIYYLDSPTDYREYLPQNCVRPRTVPGNLVMLESSACSQKSKARHSSPWLVALLMLLISWFLLRLGDVW
jgi:hypothetical protein